MVIAILLFAVTYVSMLVFAKYRTYIALGSALIFLVSGMLPLSEVIPSIDFNVLLMIAGTMGLVQLFIDSRMPALLADLVMERVPNVQMAAVALSLFAGIISAFVDNMATVLMVAPIALEICKKLKTNPVPFLIAVAVSSNLQGAATLVGDTTAIMLGSYADMSFLNFFWYLGKPGIFFAVELGALVSALILAWLFRKEKGSVEQNGARTVVTGLAAALEMDPTLLYFGLLSGATLGGNCTPIGASANITGIGILRKEGYEVKNSDFSASAFRSRWRRLSPRTSISGLCSGNVSFV